MITALLVSLVACVLAVEGMNGQFGFSRPLIAATIIGLVLGDVTTGVTVGVTLQLIFMGISGVGAAVPPNQLIGTIIATTFAIVSGEGPEIALTLAIPVAVAAQAIDIFGRTINTFFIHAADKAAAEGNYKKLELCHFGGLLVMICKTFIIVFPAVYFGIDAVQGLIAMIPAQVLRGLEVSGGILPAVGFGMLLTMLDIKHLIPFFFIGFALATFGGFSIVGVTMVAVSIALIYDHFQKNSGNDMESKDDLDALMSE